MIRSVCVFASSSNDLDKPFFDCAATLGRSIARRGFRLVFGGGADGLMGALARGAAECGGAITGVIPDFMNMPGVAFQGCTELITTSTMRERKAAMEQRSDAFIALPGGFGTLEEILEIITLRQLGRHSKPIALISALGFYDPLAAQFDRIVSQRFAQAESLLVFSLVDTPEAALRSIENAVPGSFVKCFGKEKKE